MSNPIVRAVQQRLRELGYDPGPTDGEYGPRTTSAVRAFQLATGVKRDDGSPLQYPGTLGPATLKALGLEPSAPAVLPPWMVEADRVRGLHEKVHHADLRSFLSADGRTLGDPAKLPWCGDFVETCVRLALPTEPIPESPYGARNWLTFGIDVGPVAGAVAVFWRGSKAGWRGHVAFLEAVSSDGSKVFVLGGNQNDRVATSALPSSRLLGYRWPKTYPVPSDSAAPVADMGAALATSLI